MLTLVTTRINLSKFKLCKDQTDIIAKSSLKTVGPSSIIRPLKSKTPITEMIPEFSIKMKNNYPRGQSMQCMSHANTGMKPFPCIPSFQTWEASFKLLQSTSWPSIQNILEMLFVRLLNFVLTLVHSHLLHIHEYTDSFLYFGLLPGVTSFCNPVTCMH